MHGNKDARGKVRDKTMNFSVFREIDEQEADHALSFNNYHKEGTGHANYQHRGLPCTYRFCNSEQWNWACWTDLLTNLAQETEPRLKIIFFNGR